MNDIHTIFLKDIFANPNQPRKHFDQTALEELSRSITQYGVLEPIVLTPRDGRFMIIAGERRFRASKAVGLTEIPARVIEASDELVDELALLENVQRQDLNAIEEAKAYQALLDRGWNKEKLAARLGFKQTWRVDERLGLLNLDPLYQKMLIDGKLTGLQALKMSYVPRDKQHIVFKKIMEGKLDTANKLRAFIEGLLQVEKQGSIFEFQLLSLEERRSITDFSNLLKSAERFISACFDEGRVNHLKKAVFHDVDVNRLDLVISALMKIRKTVLTGKGIKDAFEEKTAN